MDSPRKWKASKADDDWKVSICKRDAERAVDLISGIAYILDNPGQCTIEESADVLRRFSGNQIADALLDYRNKALRSIMHGETSKTD
jgi:hypothetical protein